MIMSKRTVMLLVGCLVGFSALTQTVADSVDVISPDKNLVVSVLLDQDGRASYHSQYKGKIILENSPLGLVSNVADFSKGLRLISHKEALINESYTENRIKRSNVVYRANELVCSYETLRRERIDIVFRVSNNDIAVQYKLFRTSETARCIIEKELTGFKFPSFTTTFLTPQAKPLSGWKKTKPSYEEEYMPDEPIGKASKYGLGYTFPALFHIGSNGWALVSETGVSSLYCGSRLSEGTKDGVYTVAYPEAGENNGIGNAHPAISLPGETPWRTITIGDQLKPIVETTIAFDLVKPLYRASTDYTFGRSTWSWLEWQDSSMNYNDQKTFIDLASSLGFEFVLIDALWDTQVRYERTEELVRYAKAKNVNACLWYNSNGFWNDAPQGPKNRMNGPITRKKELAWMQRIGVKSIKVDFFGGDKQETMKLYEDILSDANDYGIGVIFHGCTLPRGWERMYPNFLSAEAVLASENLIFTQHANDNEAYNACLHPFIRNSVASMDFGPVLLNKRHNRNNSGGNIRRTTEIFQLATSVIFQSPIQNFGITPNNLDEFPGFVIDFLKKVPTVWDETVFIDGYPGKYCVLARRSKEKWFIAGINADKEVRKVKINFSALSGKALFLYSDDGNRFPQMKKTALDKKGNITLVIQPGGGVVLTGE